MPELIAARRYSFLELERMRAALLAGAASDTGTIEDQIRTAMAAGVEPEEMEAAAIRAQEEEERAWRERRAEDCAWMRLRMVANAKDCAEDAVAEARRAAGNAPVRPEEPGHRIIREDERPR